MKRLTKHIAMALAGTALLLATTSIANAEKAESSIQYHGGKKQFDKKIEAAAIKKAAEKIGDLRGSLDGIDSRYLIKLEDLDGSQSSNLGFPIIEEPLVDRDVTTGSIPLV